MSVTLALTSRRHTHFAAIALNHTNGLPKGCPVTRQRHRSQIVANALVLGNVGNLAFRLCLIQIYNTHMVFLVQLFQVNRNGGNGIGLGNAGS